MGILSSEEMKGQRKGQGCSEECKGQSSRSEAPEKLFDHKHKRDFEYHWKQIPYIRAGKRSKFRA